MAGKKERERQKSAQAVISQGGEKEKMPGLRRSLNLLHVSGDGREGGKEKEEEELDCLCIPKAINNGEETWERRGNILSLNTKS